jgi:sulfonate dioxygenase
MMYKKDKRHSTHSITFTTMSPVATSEHTSSGSPTSSGKVSHPFYSPSVGDDGDTSYPFAQYKVCSLPQILKLSLFIQRFNQPSFPNVSWEPLKEIAVTDRGLSADPAKQSLFSAAHKIKHLTPAIGTEIIGIDLRQLSATQKDEL